MAHYAASKGGVIGLTKALAVELARSGITVNTIPPSLVDTPMARQAEADGDFPGVDVVGPMFARPGRYPGGHRRGVLVPVLRGRQLHHRSADRRQRGHVHLNWTAWPGGPADQRARRPRRPGGPASPQTPGPGRPAIPQGRRPGRPAPRQSGVTGARAPSNRGEDRGRRARSRDSDAASTGSAVVTVIVCRAVAQRDSSRTDYSIRVTRMMFCSQ